MRDISFKMAANTLEIMFYGDIGDEFDGITSKQFAEALKPHSKASEIMIRMNSIGGDAYEASAIYNTLKRHKAKVYVDVDGAALSAASLVAMAADKISMAENAMMMIHEPWTFTMGTADDMRATADMLEKMTGIYSETYAKRSKQTKKNVLAMLKEETWMTADEAVSFGFADEVIGSKRVAARAVPDGRFKHTPPELVVREGASTHDYRAKLEAMLNR